MDPWLDRAAARRGAAAAAIGVNVLAREVEARLIERMQYVKLKPQRIVDAGCGVGGSHLHLRPLYPDADIVSVDFSLTALRQARMPAHWLARLRGLLQPQHNYWLAADMARLPFPPASCELLWSNLSLAWADDALACIKEWQRVLKVGGLLMFTTYGPDTLKELRAAFAAEDNAPHVHPFIDLHDVGDMLMTAGFAEPVMDMEMLTLTYSDAPSFLAELRATGQTNAALGRRRGLTGKTRWHAMLSRYAAMARDGRIPATFEIVYGHAWKPAPRETGNGQQIIQFKAWGGRST